jgi:hypothetical protein
VKNYLKKKNRPGLVEHTCNPNYAGGIGRRIIVKRLGPWAKSVRPYLKNS